MDALASFDHLVQNIPSWLSKLDELSAQVAKQHAHFMRLTYSTEMQLARQKTGSTESLRPQERNEIITPSNDKSAEVTVTSMTPEDPQHSQANDALAIKEARRKRKPGSAPSATSGPSKYRTRSMVIVYYDSNIQDAFEELVRNIATARNNLRKGRTAATFKARMASLGMGPNLFSAGGGRQILDPRMAQFSKRSNPDLVAVKGSAFDIVDQDLEKAQSLCESAAHQFLRDGDCHDEIRTTRESFQKSIEIAQKEVEKLREEKAKETAEEETTHTEKLETEVTHTYLSPKVVEPLTTKPVQFAGIGTIEVDDDNNSDTESVHIDMSAIRRTIRRA